MILSIDPGTTRSAYVFLETPSLKPVRFGILDNHELHTMLCGFNASDVEAFAIEMMQSFGMSIGQAVLETCVWIGRYGEVIPQHIPRYFIYRKSDECMHLCHSMQAGDSNIAQALRDRFGDKGTKANPGWFYGVSKDVWNAIAVGVVAYDKYYQNGAWVCPTNLFYKSM